MPPAAAAPRRRPLREVARGGRERQHAATVVLAVARDLGQRAQVEELGRPEHVARAVEAQAAPAAAGRERHLGLRLDAVAGPVARDGGQRQVPVRCRRRVAGEQRIRLVALDSGGGDHVHDVQARLGQRAGLVQADHGHRRERLDRVQLLGQHAAAGHPTEATA